MICMSVCSSQSENRLCMSVCSSQSHNLCSKSVLCFLSALATCCRNSLAHLAHLAGPCIYREGLSGWTPRRAPICVKHVLPLHSDSTGFPTETKWVWVKIEYPNSWMVNTKNRLKSVVPQVLHFDSYPNLGALKMLKCFLVLHESTFQASWLKSFLLAVLP